MSKTIQEKGFVRFGAVAGRAALTAVVVSLMGLGAPARAESFNVLYAFTGGLDGSVPQVALDGQGNILGVSQSGGIYGAGPSSSNGTVFTLAPSGSLTTLHAFRGAPDGRFPTSVTANAAGILYGTAYGGPNSCASPAGNCGELFSVAVGSNEVIRLHAFVGGSEDGSYPSSVTLDAAGNIYGATYHGGNEGCYDRWGCGTLFTLSAAGKYHVIHRFTSTDDGDTPNGNLVLDSGGNVYGTTGSGGSSGNGVVFKVSPAGVFTVLHAFSGLEDGGTPGGLVLDASGNLYGATFRGGAGSAGVIYEISANANFSVLYTFKNKQDGGGPGGALAVDSVGDIFGTAEYGGQSAATSSCASDAAIGSVGCGVLFKLNASGKLTVLHAFSGLGDGGTPVGVIRRENGHLYGATRYGGPFPLYAGPYQLSGYSDHGGTIYEVVP